MIPKENIRHIEALEAKADALKARIKRLHVIASGAKLPFWDSLKEEIELSIKASKHVCDNLLESDGLQDRTAEETLILLKERAHAVRAYKGILDNVERAEAKIMKCNDDIKECKEAIVKLSGDAPRPERRSHVP
jgi:hypothetical protein